MGTATSPAIPHEPRDSSAAALVCSALHELRTFVGADAAPRNNALAGL